MILHAPLILPITSSPIKNGALYIEEDRIQAIGTFQDILAQHSSPMLDLENCVLLPGLVNAHCHLELTGLEGLSYPGNFTAWIRKIVEEKPKHDIEAYEKGMKEGIERSLKYGTTCIGDHVSFNTSLKPLLESPLRGIAFIEILGVLEEVSRFVLDQARLLIEEHSKWKMIPSPHAVHSLHLKTLQEVLRQNENLFSIHLAESSDEEFYFKEHSGELYHFIVERTGAPLPFRKGLSALQILEHAELLSNRILAIHANYVDEKDISLIKKHHISVVHCPSSHAYFNHQGFRLKDLQNQKINVALGTDSLSSGDSLSLWDQMRLASKKYPEVRAKEWIEMATLNGARALQMDSEIGSLEPGKKADLIVVRLDPFPKTIEEIYEALLQTKEVVFSMIDGVSVFKM
ncbi:MAG: amidohydrolase family protein [Deltaproteobacteria bacterium]|nr:amidohydrolase family protein [Deltaproteobacteria bacterium]